MAQNKNRPSDDEIAQRIGEILEAIRTPEHADDIIEIRKIVRKNVPFFFRSYFAAYLLKDSLSGGGRRGQRDRDRDRDRPGRDDKRELPRDGARDKDRKAQAAQEPRPRRDEGERKARDERKGEDRKNEERKNERMAPLPEGVESATLFVSAGRKRHFYPRHLLELFAGADIPRESIGEIRLFDNYTFVQILASDAAQAVERLDGSPFKGRKLTVNFARKKEESGEGRSERGASHGGASESESVEELPALEPDERDPEAEPSDQDAGFDLDAGESSENDELADAGELADADALAADDEFVEEDGELDDGSEGADSSFEDVLYDPDAESSEDPEDDGEGELEELEDGKEEGDGPR